MKEFIEKLIGRLEEETYVWNDGYRNGIKSAIAIVNQLAEEYKGSNDSMEIQIAKNYAKCLIKYGVDIREKWETATQQSMVLEQAYLRGRQDERNKFAEWQDEHKGGWIPTSERLPEKNAIVLTCDKDGWISVKVNMPYAGVKNDFESGYYTAWMPLPEPFTPKEGRE